MLRAAAVVTAAAVVRHDGHSRHNSRGHRNSRGRHDSRGCHDGRGSQWIFEIVFANFGVLFWLILAHPGASGPQKTILDDLTDLRAQNESSGARLETSFRLEPRPS